MQSADIICKDCGKKCKSKGGYKRHDENRVNSDESNTNADKTRKTSILTAVILTKIVLKVLNSQVISSFQSMVSDAEIVTISNVNKDVICFCKFIYKS